MLRKILLWLSFLTLSSGQLELSALWTIYSKKHLFSVLMAFDLPAFDLQNIKRKTLCDVYVMILWFPSKSNGAGKIIPCLMQTCV